MKNKIASELQNRDYINLNYNSQLMKKKIIKSEYYEAFIIKQNK